MKKSFRGKLTQSSPFLTPSLSPIFSLDFTYSVVITFIVFFGLFPKYFIMTYPKQLVVEGIFINIIYFHFHKRIRLIICYIKKIYYSKYNFILIHKCVKGV